ncbi:hypothetical protein WJX72_002293 [[Myrmecia] bisecta]|uniref:Uncharacterized protein n=1 Tax=[Myrmecia] bisecta TaxID=41462 RepID=A0AAW1R579_9CHLO
MLNWWWLVPKACQQEFVAVAIWLAEETASPERGATPAIFPAPLGPQTLDNCVRIGYTTDHESVVQELLGSLRGWEALLWAGNADENRAGLRVMLGLTDFYTRAGKDMAVAQQQQGQHGLDLFDPIEPALYWHFKISLQGHMEPSDIERYCSCFGFVQICEDAPPPMSQRSHFAAHMAALSWMVAILRGLYCCEVASRWRVVLLGSVPAGALEAPQTLLQGAQVACCCQYNLHRAADE